MVTDLPEAGMLCVLLVGDVRQKALLVDSEVAVGFNALGIDDDDECGVGGLRTMWVERRSLRCVDGEYEGDFPIMPTSARVMDRGDSSPGPQWRRIGFCTFSHRHLRN